MRNANWIGILALAGGLAGCGGGDSSPETFLEVAMETPADELTRATFTFSMAGAGWLETSLDDAPFATGVSPVVLTGLEPGTHRFRVRAVAADGTVDPTPESYEWTVLPAVQTEVVATVHGFDATLDLKSNVEGARFQARFGGTAWADVPNPVRMEGLERGEHPVLVRAVAPDGREDRTPVLHVVNAAPVLSVTFPPGPATTTQPTVLVCGVTNSNQVVRISVNDVPVNTSNAFAAWNARVPLEPGANPVRILCTMANGETVEDPGPVVVREPPSFAPRDIAVQGDQLLVLDSARKLLLRVEPDGSESRVSGAGAGSGYDFAQPGLVTVTPDGQQAIVFDHRYCRVIAVDLSTGARTLVTGGAFSGIGVDVYGVPHDAQLMTDGKAAFVIGLRKTIVAVDLKDGTRSLLWRATDGELDGIAGNVFDPLFGDAGRILIANDASNEIIEVDVAAGEARVLVADDGEASTRIGTGSRGMWLEADRESVLLFADRADATGADLLRIRLDTGARTRLELAGADVRKPSSIAVIGDVAHIAEATRGRISMVELADVPAEPFDVRTLRPLAGVALNSAGHVVWDPNGDRILVLDDAGQRILAVDRSTGRTATVAGLEATGLVGEAHVNADDDFTVWVNGVLVLRNDDNAVQHPAPYISFRELLVPGRNVIALAADNITGAEWALFDGRAGPIDDPFVLQSGSEWRAAPADSVALGTAWTRPEFDDSAWAPASAPWSAAFAPEHTLLGTTAPYMWLSGERRANFRLTFDLPFVRAQAAASENEVVVLGRDGTVSLFDRGSETAETIRTGGDLVAAAVESAEAGHVVLALVPHSGGAPLLLDIDTATREITELAAPPENAPAGDPGLGFAFDRTGNKAYCPAEDGAVLEIQIANGAYRSIEPVGAVVTHPVDLVFEPAAQRLLAVDATRRALVAIDPETGRHTVLSGAGVGLGVDFENPTAVSLDEERNLAYVADGDRVIVVDLGTAERIISAQ